MSQPTQQDYDTAFALMPFNSTSAQTDTVATAIAQARTEGAEAMRERCAVYMEDSARTNHQMGTSRAECERLMAYGKAIRNLPTSEGDTTTTEDTGEETQT